MAMLIHGEIVLMPLLDASNILERKQKNKQKTLQQRQRLWERNQDKHLLNQQLRNTLPIFTSDKPYQIIFINYMTAFFFVILRLIERARKTRFFLMDTETDDYSRRPAIIQIEFIEFQYNVNNVKEENITIQIVI
jgi:hypothetical protein